MTVTAGAQVRGRRQRDRREFGVGVLGAEQRRLLEQRLGARLVGHRERRPWPPRSARRTAAVPPRPAAARRSRSPSEGRLPAAALASLSCPAASRSGTRCGPVLAPAPCSATRTAMTAASRASSPASRSFAAAMSADTDAESLAIVTMWYSATSRRSTPSRDRMAQDGECGAPRVHRSPSCRACRPPCSAPSTATASSRLLRVGEAFVPVDEPERPRARVHQLGHRRHRALRHALSSASKLPIGSVAGRVTPAMTVSPARCCGLVCLRRCEAELGGELAEHPGRDDAQRAVAPPQFVGHDRDRRLGGLLLVGLPLLPPGARLHLRAVLGAQPLVFGPAELGHLGPDGLAAVDLVPVGRARP